jgi:hypothetical protein
MSETKKDENGFIPLESLEVIKAVESEDADSTQALLDLLFPPSLEAAAREGDNPIFAYDIFAMGVRSSGKTELSDKLAEVAVERYGEARVNAVRIPFNNLYTGLNSAPVQIQHADDATFIKPPRDMLERWKAGRHLALKAGVPKYGRLLTIFGTHELVRLNRDIRATSLPINIYKTVPVGEWDEPRMIRRLGSANVQLLYKIGQAIMIGGKTAMEYQQYSVVEIPHIKAVFKIKLPLAKHKYFRQVKVGELIHDIEGGQTKTCKVCGKPFRAQNSSHQLCSVCYRARVRPSGVSFQ